MVFEQEVPCLSPRNIFIQYLRRALREILQQVCNGIENDCISFRLEQTFEVLLRSTSVFQDGGQLLSVLRRALVIVQGPPEDASTDIFGHSLTSICAIFRHSFTSICTLTTTGSKKPNSFVEERGNSMRLTIARLICHFV